MPKQQNIPSTCPPLDFHHFLSMHVSTSAALVRKRNIVIMIFLPFNLASDHFFPTYKQSRCTHKMCINETANVSLIDRH